jgi:hypothetical protein
MQQFHVVRRLSGVLAGLAGLLDLDKAKPDNATSNEDKVAALLAGFGEKNMSEMLEPLIRELTNMSDDDAEYIILTCLTVVMRKQSGGGWAKVVVDGQFMFQDMDMVIMLTLTAKVVMGNMKGFFAALPGDIPGAIQT